MDIKQKSNNSHIIIEKEKKRGGFWRFFLFSFYVLIIGAIGAMIADRAIFPRMAQSEFFKNWDFLKRAVENTTIINKTEQIVIPGDFLAQKIFEENKNSIIELGIRNYPPECTHSVRAGELRNELDKEKNTKKISYGFAVTQDGIIFIPGGLSVDSDENSFIVKNYQGEEREAELIKEKSDEDIAVIKYSGNSLNISILDFASSVKPGEEAAVITQDSVITAFVKSVSDEIILLNDYPDQNMNGALVLNKEEKIIGMYISASADSKFPSYVISANVLKEKINQILK